MVEVTATTAKTETQVMWVAPKIGAGCVAISASVWTETSVDGGGQWVGDNDQLLRIVCEATAADQAAASQAANSGRAECCACDEAKYKVSICERAE